jgi:hypothetical protein
MWGGASVAVSGRDTSRCALHAALRRSFEFGPGSIIGDEDFFLQRPRRFSAVCGVLSSCHLRRLERSAFDALKKKAPESLIVLQSMLLRSVCFTEAHTLETLERSAYG